MSKPKRKTLGERVAEKWYPLYIMDCVVRRNRLAYIVDREAKKVKPEPKKRSKRK